MAEQLQEEEKRNLIGLILAGVAAASLLLFVFQNTEKQEVNFLFFTWTMPLFLLIFVTMALTLIVAVIVAWVMNRRSKKG